MNNELVTIEALDEWAWFKCYFNSSHENWDGKTYKRNFAELKLRDQAILTLGDIEGKKVLDVGCGWGLYAIVFARLGAVVYGQDLNEDSIARGKKLMSAIGVNVTFKLGDARSLLFDDNSIDVVFSGDFFEHISNEDKVLVIREVYRVLKPGGLFTIKTPNLTYLKISLLFKKVKAITCWKNPLHMYIPHTNYNPDCEHHGLISHAGIGELLENNMFQFEKIAHSPLIRRGLPLWLGKILSKFKIFNEHIIITVKKPVFFGFWP